MSPRVVGVDVGGTFTDVVVLNPDSGDVLFAKALTTPNAPAEGVMRALEEANVDLREVTEFFHGTTLGLNTMLQGTGAKVGLITTRGFRDTLEIGRMDWPMYVLHWNQPPPLVPRYLRKEVTERVRADGTVLDPLAEDEIVSAASELLAEGVEQIAIIFLHAYAYPEHELAAGALIEETFPDCAYNLSHQVAREYREYERTATTVVDALTRPRLRGYVAKLQKSLHDEGFSGQLLFTRSDGGVMGAEEATRRSIQTLISGPASGVCGAAEGARRLGLNNIIAIDVGGTSFDAAVVTSGYPSHQHITAITGLPPLLMPSVEIATIGAGGGSIAWISPGGALDVGPKSAGSTPGPISYGLGGTQPTFTDAALLSGLLSATSFLDGKMTLDIEATREGMRTSIADPLGISVEEAATSIVAIIEAKMADTVEEISVGKGLDPRDYALFAYGGGGSLVASAIADRLSIPTIVVPPSPGTFSAWGMLTLDVVHDFAKTFVRHTDFVAIHEVRQAFVELHGEALERLVDEEVPPADRRLLDSLDMRYELQEHALSVPVHSIDELDLDALRVDFAAAHLTAYGYTLDEAVELVACRTRAVGHRAKPEPAFKPQTGGTSAIKTTRIAHHYQSGGRLEWTVYDRRLMAVGDTAPGPALVEEASTTTLIAPGQSGVIDGTGNLVISNPPFGSVEGTPRDDS